MASEDGFTLLEIILSIGILALISGFILEMFIVSANVNKKAKDMDMALNYSMNSIEVFKKLEKFEDFIRDPFYASCSVEQLPGGELLITKYFDESWKDVPVEYRLAEYEALEAGVSFFLELKAHKRSNIGEDAYLRFSSEGDYIQSSGLGNACEISSSVFQMGKSEEGKVEKKEFVSLEAEKYFSF
jgi:prepilin-type N-terminal cleavage/methylation domain-containing protein